MESLRTKDQTEILEIKSFFSQIKKNMVESHSRILEQVEDRISRLKDKIIADFSTETLKIKKGME
jgi:hypothetical protein